MLEAICNICLVEQVAIQPFPPLPLITNENAGQERKVAALAERSRHIMLSGSEASSAANCQYGCQMLRSRSA